MCTPGAGPTTPVGAPPGAAVTPVPGPSPGPTVAPGPALAGPAAPTTGSPAVQGTGSGAPPAPPTDAGSGAVVDQRPQDVKITAVPTACSTVLEAIISLNPEFAYLIANVSRPVLPAACSCTLITSATPLEHHPQCQRTTLIHTQQGQRLLHCLRCFPAPIAFPWSLRRRVNLSSVSGSM
jgi:hypothetical protein